LAHFIKIILATFTILPVILLANTSTNISTSTKIHNLAIDHTIKGDIQKEYNTMVEKKLKTIDFKVTDPHKRVNDQYEIKWGKTMLDVLSFMPIVNDKVILPLLNIDPRIAGFAPFNLLIYKKHDENMTHIGHLQPEVMLNMLKITDQEVRKKFTAPFSSLDTMIEKELGSKKNIMPYKKLPEKTMINYEYPFETPKDMEDFIDEFQNNFEQAFIDKGYLIAGFHNFMEATDDANKILSDYKAFWTYSLCHLEFSYNMFDTQVARPDAGLFAPCTMYMYIRKGSNKVVIGMIRLHNWSDTLGITDTKRLSLIEKLDTEIPDILESLGMKSVPNVNPLLKHKDVSSSTKKQSTTTKEKTTTPSTLVTSKTKEKKPQTTRPTSITKVAKIEKIKIGNKTVTIAIPKVPQAIKCNSTNYNAGTERSIKFSKRIPPNYKPHSFDRSQKAKTSTHTRIGEVNHGKISAYLRGNFMTIDTAKEKLKAAGFTIITVAPINKKEDLISIVFTDKTLLAMANKENRGFIASLRLLVDTKEKTISITNPLYMAKGFLQNDFDETNANKILARLLTQFTDLSNSKDTLKFQLLPKYQFMKGMPHFQDMVEVASGKNLLEKIKNNDKVVFTQTLKNGATLIGIKLSKRTNKFIKRIGRNNAAMLPYPILIENGKAKILDPKYYISFMYPLLTMSEFMTIATVPDAMIKDCQKVFK